MKPKRKEKDKKNKLYLMNQKYLTIKILHFSYILLQKIFKMWVRGDERKDK